MSSIVIIANSNATIGPETLPNLTAVSRAMAIGQAVSEQCSLDPGLVKIDQIRFGQVIKESSCIKTAWPALEFLQRIRVLLGS